MAPTTSAIYTTTDFTSEGPGSYDVILSTVAGCSFAGCLATLAPGGRYLIANPRLADICRSARTPTRDRKEAFVAFAGETREELLELKAHIEAKRIQPTLDRVYPMAEAAEAHRRVETEMRQGSVVLALA